MQYGLSKIGVINLSNQSAKSLKLKYPTNWDETRLGGREWLEGFMHRSPHLSLRTPESTSLSRSILLIKQMYPYFWQLDDTMGGKQFSPQTIYNIDETGLTSV